MVVVVAAVVVVVVVGWEVVGATVVEAGVVVVPPGAVVNVGSEVVVTAGRSKQWSGSGSRPGQSQQDEGAAHDRGG